MARHSLTKKQALTLILAFGCTEKLPHRKH
jgi:hypothetical protein